jgi:PAS domain S-box-containing protein
MTGTPDHSETNLSGTGTTRPTHASPPSSPPAATGRLLDWFDRSKIFRLMPAPVWVLLLVLLLTVAATATVQSLVKRQQQARFEREITTYQRELRQRFEGYTSVLIAVRAAWEAMAQAQEAAAQKSAAQGSGIQRSAIQPALNLQQFSRLAAGLELNAHYPGLMNLGYAPLIVATERSRFAAQLPLLAADPSARLHPTSKLGYSTPVTYLAPAAGNRSVLGYDMYSDAVRRRAIDGAIRSGSVQATEQVELFNLPANNPDRAGMILYLPLRETPAPGRQPQVTGLVYSPLQISSVLPVPPVGSGEDRMNVSISLAGQRLSSPVVVGKGVVGEKAAGKKVAGFSDTETLNLAGQSWTLDFTAPAGFGRDAATNIPWLVLLAGSLVALLAAFSTQAQVNGRQRAEQVNRSLSLSQSRLERSRAEFEAVFRAMQDTAVFTDPAGRVLFANDALHESFGLDPLELRGALLSDLHGDPELLAQLARLPGPHLVTTPFRRRGRTSQEGSNLEEAAQQAPDIFYGEMQRSRVIGEGGETLGHLEVIRDVSERLQSDRALREGERRYQGVLEGMPQIVFLADVTGRVSYFNQRWWEYVGQPPAAPQSAAHQSATGQSATGQSAPSTDILWAIHPDDRAEFSQRWQAALATGNTLEVEHRLRSAGGVYRTFVTRGRPVRTPQGQVQEWVGSSTDIDDQMYAELNSRLLADVGQALSDRHLLEVTSPPRSFWEADSGLREALGLITARFADSAVFWPSPRVQGTDQSGAADQSGPEASAAERSDTQQPSGFAPPGSTLPPPLVAGRARRIGLQEVSELERIDSAVWQAMSGHEPSIFQGERLHGLGLSSAVLYPLSQDDLHLGVLGLGFRHPLQDRDLELARELAQRLTSALDNRNLLTWLQAARASLQDLNNSLEQRVSERTVQLSEANSELEAFSYSVSHDLRTPLRHILGFSELLKRETGEGASAKAKRYMTVISESADRMSKLIDDLLEFSRTSRAELRRDQVDLGLLVQGTLEELAPDQGDRTVHWQVGPLPQVIGDAGLLRQVIGNLLSNALKYTRTRAEAVIEIAAQQHGREVWLSIRDNGVGFDPEYVSKLFGVFQRLHRNEEFEGTGIGLANVRRIVSRHGGRVWAESGDQARPGATFWVALPLELLSLEKGKQAKVNLEAGYIETGYIETGHLEVGRPQASEPNGTEQHQNASGVKS